MIDAMDGLDTQKLRLMGNPEAKRVGFENWEIEVAHLPSDIIWQNMNQFYMEPFLIKLMLWVLPLIVSTGCVFLIFFLEEYFSETHLLFLKFIMKYLAPALLCCFSLIFMPYFIFLIERKKKRELKSEKESSFFNRNTIFMLLNSLILPFIVSAIFVPSFREEQSYQPSIPK